MPLSAEAKAAGVFFTLSALLMQSCAADHSEYPNQEQHKMATRCEFSERARTKLLSLGFFSVGDDQELFLDREIHEGMLNNIDVDLDGVSWFYAYPWCDKNSISYENLPDLLKIRVSERSRFIVKGRLTVFFREELPTDLMIISFDDFQIAFFAR